MITKLVNTNLSFKNFTFYFNFFEEKEGEKLTEKDCMPEFNALVLIKKAWLVVIKLANREKN